MSTNTVILEEVCKTFGTVHAVDWLNVQVPAGSIYGILGPNGAGKTTTIRMMMNIISPDSGRVLMLDSDSVEQAKDRIGYMPEERGLYPKMTLRGVLAYLAALKGMRRVDIGPAIRDWLKTVDLLDWADKKVHELSRGMQQRLQFAACAINDPDLLILDEPFSGLDPVNLELLKDIVLRLREAGKTIIFSTHMMEQAENLCDFILLINRGEKVLDGSLDEIRAQYESDAVIVDVEGDAGFIDDLPMVESTTRTGRKLEIALKDNADDQELLQALVGNVRVRSFELKVPSLHEIFVRVVGTNGV